MDDEVLGTDPASDGIDVVRPDPVENRRDIDAHDRDDLADRRDESGDERDRSGQRRDTSGVRRDQALDLLDEQAALADHAAIERDRVASKRAKRYLDGRIDPQLAQQAVADREDNRLDRVRAGQDRLAGAAERVEARLDRSTASTNRTASLDDRSQSGLDRNTALADRRNAAIDRGIATFDDLTGVYRRGPGLVELEREIARTARTGERLVLAFVDVDGLKAVNDSLGHEAGDSLLVAVADALATWLRPYDMIVRFGGDEFVCFTAGLTMEGAEERLASVSADLAVSGRSISVGLATLEEHETSSSLLARADRTLYLRRAERRGLAVPDASAPTTDLPEH